MKLSEAMKKKLTLVGAVVLAAFVVYSLLTNDLEHMEDTNGPENYSLQTITEEQILDLSTGALGGPAIRKSTFTGSALEFSSDKFTGVAEILYDNFLLPSDFVLDITNYNITGGNFQMVVVHNDEIVAVLEPDMFVSYRLEDVTGYVSLRIVGESASFTFSMSEFDYDFHSHAE